MSSGSSSGSGADQHLLALLRAIRLRQAAPDAVEAGAADTAAALTRPEDLTGGAPRESAEISDETHPEWEAGAPRPDWASNRTADLSADESDDTAADQTDISEMEPAGDGVVDAGAAVGGSFFDRGAVLRPHAEPARHEERADVAAPVSGLFGRPRWASGDQSPAARASGVPQMPETPARPPRFEGVTAAPGRAPAVDGMDPADDALLRQTQGLLRESLDFAGGANAVADRLRLALRTARPEVVAALPGDAATQTTKLAAGLIWLVDHLAQPPLLVGGSARLGAALAACGVPPRGLQFVGAALAEALRAGSAAGEWRQEFELAWRSTWQHVYEWMQVTDHDEPVSWTAVVVSHELRRPDLAVIRLRPYLPMPFRPGQYARIEVNRLPGIWRPYSPAGAPRRDDLVELHVRAKTETGVSGTLVHHTVVGDEVRIGRAEGEMGLPEEPGRNLLMIAGDTGVAPLKALLTELADSGDARSAVLFWGVRDLAELYDIDEIAEIARLAKRATVVPVVSEGDPGPYASGLVTDAVAAYGEWSRHEVYLAGPPLMLAATSAALRLLGVHPDRIHHDAPE